MFEIRHMQACLMHLHAISKYQNGQVCNNTVFFSEEKFEDKKKIELLLFILLQFVSYNSRAQLASNFFRFGTAKKHFFFICFIIAEHKKIYSNA